MAANKELAAHLALALEEIGEIKPWYDRRFKAWVFSHELYKNVEYAGTSKQEVIERYPLYLKEFIYHRLKGTLSSVSERGTRGKGGYRVGAGRPKGSIVEEKRRIYLPVDLADWLSEYSHLEMVRQIMLQDKSKTVRK